MTRVFREKKQSIKPVSKYGKVMWKFFTNQSSNHFHSMMLLLKYKYKRNVSYTKLFQNIFSKLLQKQFYLKCKSKMPPIMKSKLKRFFKKREQIHFAHIRVQQIQHHNAQDSAFTWNNFSIWMAWSNKKTQTCIMTIRAILPHPITMIKNKKVTRHGQLWTVRAV